MNLGLTNKRILISGGAKGIGRAIVDVVADEGGIPLILDRDQEHIEQTIATLKSKGQQCYGAQVELTDHLACQKAFDVLIEKAGGIDALVNNAGVNDNISLTHDTHEQFLASIHKNLVHYYTLAQLALPHLKAAKGAIVNISSKVSVTGQGSTSAYAAANGGRNALTREWAVELLPHGIRVNAVIVAECMTPLYENWIQSFDDPKARLQEIVSKIPLEHRMTKPAEIAQTVAFLLSEKSSHTTGQMIFVDGGYTHLDRAL